MGIVWFIKSIKTKNVLIQHLQILEDDKDQYFGGDLFKICLNLSIKIMGSEKFKAQINLLSFKTNFSPSKMNRKHTYNI